MTLMKVSTFLKRVNYALRGTDDDVPTAADEDGTYWIETLNRKKDEMYNDPNKNWASAYDNKLAGTMVLGANSFALNDANVSSPLLSTFISPARSVYVLDTNGQRHHYPVAKPDELDYTQQQAYFYGINPKTLKFTLSLKAGDILIGGSVYIPGYWMPADLDPAASGIADLYIPVDDANWGVMATAAQVAFNDITYEDKFDDLQGQADVLWKNMVKANRRKNRGNAQTTPYNVPRIRGVR